MYEKLIQHLNLVVMDATCPECGHVQYIPFTESSVYTVAMSNPDKGVAHAYVYEYVESQLALDDFDEVERGEREVHIYTQQLCGDQKCLDAQHNTAYQKIVDNIQLPARLKLVPPAHSATIITPESPGVLYTGTVGAGKTYSAVSLLKKWVIDHADTTATYQFTNVTEFLFLMKESFGKRNGKNTIMRRCMDVDLLLLDDLGTEQFGEWTVSQLYLLINHRLDNMRPTIITTNLQLSQIGSRISERVASRLALYRTINVKGSDRRTT